MGKNIILHLTIILSLSTYAYGLDCPADSSYHTDLRTLLPNGSPNPTLGQEIATGPVSYTHLTLPTILLV